MVCILTPLARRGSSTMPRKKSDEVTKRKKAPKVELPTELSVPSEILWDYSILIYGLKKIGKTSMWSHAENAFYFMCEPGGSALKLFQRRMHNWAEFKAYVEAFLASDFDLGIVDTVDRAYAMCLKAVCERLCIDHPGSQDDYGKSWNAVNTEFADVMDSLLHSGKGCVFISHSKVMEIKPKGGGAKYDKIMPTMPGAASAYMDAVVDIWVHYDYDGEDRELRILGDSEVSAGHRLENHFNYTDGSRVRVIDMGNSSKESFNAFNAAFQNELDNPTPPEEKKDKKKPVLRKTSKKKTKRKRSA